MRHHIPGQSNSSNSFYHFLTDIPCWYKRVLDLEMTKKIPELSSVIQTIPASKEHEVKS